MTTQEYQQRSEAINALIIELLFKQNKSYITEVTIKLVPTIKFKRVIKPFKAQTNNFNNNISL